MNRLSYSKKNSYTKNLNFNEIINSLKEFIDILVKEEFIEIK